MSEWQPIETAPKDGDGEQRLLIVQGGRRFISAWDDDAGHFFAIEALDSYPVGMEMPGRLYAPTHWIPLPEPPPQREPRRFAVLVHGPHGLKSLEAGRASSVWVDTPENRRDVGEGWLPFDLVERNG